jgi:uncharacterized protein YdaT
MPWTARDVSRHNKSVKSPKRKKQWRDVANSILKRTGDDARAIRGANSVVKKSQAKRTKKRR